MKLSRLVILLVIIIVFASWFSHTSAWKRAKTFLPKRSVIYKDRNATLLTLKQKAQAAKKYTAQKGFNADRCFLIDMGLPSGENRFFIYDLKKDTIIASAPVAHGNCFEYWLEGRRYSNVVGSGCTSLGKYKVGSHYTGKFGYSYKLHGLDSTNNNAFERTVVLHSHSCVPESAVSDDICQSNGCPTVGPLFLEKLKLIINNSRKPLLLWIYDQHRD